MKEKTLSDELWLGTPAQGITAEDMNRIKQAIKRLKELHRKKKPVALTLKDINEIFGDKLT